MRKPVTILDQLTSPTVTPEILRARAGYWRIVADRHIRANRLPQADRLRVNCDAMERQAIEMETDPIVSIVSKRKAGTSIAVPNQTRAKMTFKGYSDFQAAYLAAKLAANRAHGERWYLVPHACIKARVPATWVRCMILGRPSNTPRDLNFPAGEFWATGVMPFGPEYAAPSTDLHPRVKVTSLITGETAELYDLEIPGWFAIQEALGKKLMKHPRIMKEAA